jgi:hypothetical protein
LDPLQIGNVPSETLLHQCHDLWRAYKRYRRSLRGHPRSDGTSKVGDIVWPAAVAFAELISLGGHPGEADRYGVQGGYLNPLGLFLKT